MKTLQQGIASKGIRTTMVGVLVNLVLAVVKALAGILGHSYALVADALESSFDVVSSLVVLGGLKIAARPADENHPFGHGKAEPLAAMVVAAFLVTAALGIAIQSLREIAAPRTGPAAFTLVVLVVVIIVKETLFRFVGKTAEQLQSTAVRTDAWHHRSDAITSAAAFVGISIALLGGPGYESADDWAAFLASWIIGFNGVRLFIPALREIMDAAPRPDVESTVRAVASGVPGVIGLDKCAVRKMGISYYIDLHVIVDPGISVREGHQIGHLVRDAVRQADARISDVLVHIEPEGEELDPL